MTRDPLEDTYAAALQHRLVDPPEEATLVGVVRRPTRWFSAVVDENHSSLGPPGSLLDEFEHRCEDFKLQGMCDDGAHNAAWEDRNFEERYCSHLTESPDARRAVSELVARVRDGERLVLVCFENTDAKRCHRTLLGEHITARL